MQIALSGPHFPPPMLGSAITKHERVRPWCERDASAARGDRPDVPVAVWPVRDSGEHRQRPANGSARSVRSRREGERKKTVFGDRGAIRERGVKDQRSGCTSWSLVRNQKKRKGGGSEEKNLGYDERRRDQEINTWKVAAHRSELKTEGRQRRSQQNCYKYINTRGYTKHKTTEILTSTSSGTKGPDESKKLKQLLPVRASWRPADRPDSWPSPGHARGPC